MPSSNIQQPVEPVNPQQTGEISPNHVNPISPEQAEALDRISQQTNGPTPALVEAFAQRKRNQARSRYHRDATL